MYVEDLTDEQFEQLKVNYYAERHEDMSWADVLTINSLVSDEEIFEEYAGTDFVEDDF